MAAPWRSQSESVSWENPSDECAQTAEEQKCRGGYGQPGGNQRSIFLQLTDRNLRDRQRGKEIPQGRTHRFALDGLPTLRWCKMHASLQPERAKVSGWHLSRGRGPVKPRPGVV